MINPSQRESVPAFTDVPVEEPKVVQAAENQANDQAPPAPAAPAPPPAKIQEEKIQLDQQQMDQEEEKKRQSEKDFEKRVTEVEDAVID